MHIPMRLLKTKISNDNLEPLEEAALRIDLRLRQPANEPLLMIRALFRNSPHQIYSLQLTSIPQKAHHYINIECETEVGTGLTVEQIGIAELPIAKGEMWAVSSVAPDGLRVAVGKLYCNEFNIWQYEPINQNFVESRRQSLSYALIGGVPKSGTTWVERIVNSHPDALATGENGFFSWPDRAKLLSLMSAKRPPYFARAVSHAEPFLSEAALFYSARAESTLSQIGDLAAVRCIADKSPDYEDSLPLIFSSCPEWKYIHCQRNPLDVAVSRFFHERSLLLDSPEYSLLPMKRSIRRKVLRFNPSKAKIGEMFSDKPLFECFLNMSISRNLTPNIIERMPNIHVIAYESLIESFALTVSKLYTFLGLDASPTLLNRVEDMNCFSRFAGGRERGDEDSRDFFRKGIIGDHKNYLTDSQIAYGLQYIESGNRAVGL